MTDRELLLQWQQQTKVEGEAIDQVGHYQALGIGLATFCTTFLETILSQQQLLVTRNEAMQLLVAAIQGR